MAVSASKIQLTRNFPGIVGTTGRLAIGRRVQDALVDCASFEDMIRIAPARFGELAGEDDAVAIGGYSESRGWEVYYSRAGRQGQPLQKVRDGFSGQPALTKAMLLQGFGTSRLYEVLGDIEHFAITALMLQRHDTWGPAEGYPQPVHLVGGWGELATITRTDSDVRRIIEWPDEIGEPIKPAVIDWNAWRNWAPTARKAA